MKAVGILGVIIGMMLSVQTWAQWQTPVNAGVNVNTSVADNSPCLNLAGDTLYLASFRSGGQGSADIWMSVLLGGVWQPLVNLGAPINTSGIDFSPSISFDSQELYFCGPNRPGGTGGWDVWVSHKTGGVWGTPAAISQINTSDYEAFPFITSDGQDLYFSSERPGGLGGDDIYVSHWSGTEWGAPQPIPGSVNTSDDEDHPSLTEDGHSMYFSSTRSGGFGGPDIYVSHWSGTEWGPAQNLGNAINTGNYEQFPSISGDGMKLAFVSDRAGGYGNFDIWVSEYEPTTDLWGTISLSNNPPDLSGSVVVIGTLMDTTNSQGYYMLEEVPQGQVTLMAFHAGYIPFDTLLIDAGGEYNFTLYVGENPSTFFDDFESGLTNWFGYWNLTTESSHSPTHSLTDSPGSNYSPNQNVGECMVQGVDLSDFQSALATYWTKYQLETGFDYTYLEVSTNDGATWLNLRTFNGNQDQWRADTVDIGAFAGQENVKFRFRLTSDGALELDGLYIDDFQVEGGHQDLTPPLVLHIPDPDTTSWLGNRVLSAQITDVSGVQTASLFYRLDGGSYIEIQPDSTAENDYYFTIPAQDAGIWTEYYFHAIDNATPPNSGDSEVFAHIFGTTLYFDDGDPEFIYEFSAGNQIAVRFTIPNAEPLAALFIRFYQDETHPLDSVDVYVWNDLSGFPSQVQLGPVPVYPANTLQTPQAWTRVDLRRFGLSVGPEFHTGCEYRSAFPVILGDSPAISARSHVFSGAWSVATCDFHLRAVIGHYSDIPNASSSPIPLSFDLLPVYPNPFNSTCVVSYSTNRRDHIQLSVYNILGQKVATLLDAVQEAGPHRLTWNGGNLATSIYFVQMKSLTDPSLSSPVRKVLLLK